MIAPACRDNVRVLIRAYGKATGLSVGQISKKFYGNAHFLGSFLAGRQSMSLKKFDKVIGGLRAKWPPDTPWPVTRAIVIPRPEKIS